MIRLILFLVLLVPISGVIQAQPKGKPDLSLYKEEIKAAKKGSVKSMILVGDLNKGHLYTKDEFKDYKEALEWYLEAQNTKSSLPKKAEWQLFSMYITGGYGIDKSISLAEKWLLKVPDTAEAFQKKYDYWPSLHIYELLEYEKNKSSITLTDAKILRLARIYNEFHINYNKALEFLQKLPGDPEAAYFSARWKKERSLYLNGKDKVLQPEQIEAEFYTLSQEHAGYGSNYAALDILHYLDVHNKTVSNKELRTLTKNIILRSRESDPWMYGKALYFLGKFESDQERFKTLPKFTSFAKENPEWANTGINSKFVEEAEKYEILKTSLAGFHTIVHTYDFLEPYRFPIEPFSSGFNGSMNELFKFYVELGDTKNIQLMGQELIINYQNEVLAIFDNLLAESRNTSQIMRLEREMKTRTDIRHLYPRYKDAIMAKLSSFNISQEEIIFYEEKLRIEDEKFKSYTEAKASLDKIYKRTDLGADSKAKLAGYVREKAIRDVMGNNPMPHQVDRFYTDFHGAHSWLMPEAETAYYRFKEDNDNWFNGRISYKGATFFYEVINKGDRYSLVIKKIMDNKSNLAYESQIELQKNEKNGSTSFVVNIYRAKYNKYRWELYEPDYLQVVYFDGKPLFEVYPIGGMKNYSDASHGFANDKLTMKENASDFSAKNAIRSALKYFIYEYHKIMGV